MVRVRETLRAGVLVEFVDETGHYYLDAKGQIASSVPLTSAEAAEVDAARAAIEDPRPATLDDRLAALEAALSAVAKADPVTAALPEVAAMEALSPVIDTP